MDKIFKVLNSLFLPIDLLHRLIVRCLVFLLKIWHKCSCFFLGDRCRFYPTCSCYAQEALLKHGLFYGVVLIIWRLLRCHPWARGGVENVPPVNSLSWSAAIPATRRVNDER
ncbi:MAG: membrane protein insertion efficiency factor YidD [Deltaproteobacteria bacterium]|nr:membrane protein insertion efficiency factor YidD [Deltaproteobacteria bacterium]